MSDELFSEESACVGPSSSKGESLSDLMSQLEQERFRYVTNHIVYSAIRECIDDEDLDASLSSKVLKICLCGETAQSMKLNDTTNIFGLPNEPAENLNFEEKTLLKKALADKLTHKERTLRKELKELFGDAAAPYWDDDFACQTNPQDDLRSQLRCEVERYAGNYFDRSSLLDELTTLRTQSVRRLAEEKVSEATLKDTIAEHKERILEDQQRVQIFNENRVSLGAYRIAMEDIVKQQEDCRNEISVLKELKRQYGLVASKEYEEILKSYLQYKGSVERMKYLQAKLKNVE